MTLTAGLRTPGHPGVFLAPPRTPDGLGRVRLDIAGFVGVAPRGPVDEPVLVTRWSEFVQAFGGLDPAPGGPVRLLPYAVATFFRQGGERAWVVRLAPHAPDAAPTTRATALFRIGTPGDSGPAPVLRASSEGAWGNLLRLVLTFQVGQRGDAVREAQDALRLPPGTVVTPGTLLRLSVPGHPEATALRWVDRIDERLARGDRPRVWLDAPLAVGPGETVTGEVVTGTLQIDEPGRPGERITGLGLHAGHPRWLPSVLAGEPHLVVATDDWPTTLEPDVSLGPLRVDLDVPGVDRSHLIDADSFFDPDSDDGDDLDEDETPDRLARHVGVDRVARVDEIGLLCVPDLAWRPYEPSPPPPASHPTAPRTCCCSACDPARPEPEPTPVQAAPRGLDPRAPADLAELTRRQAQVVDIASRRQRFVALLDVPDGLSLGQVTAWRARFDSGYAAAYHPWLAVAGADGTAVAVPPSSFAAGIIAERELRLGLPWGPANELARDAVRAEAVVTDALHDRLHGMGINVYRAERDGFRLTAARTLSTDPDYRQLSVRRLMTMLRLSLERETQWLAFEPNTAELRERLLRTVTGFLRGLAARGAFAGRTEAESFFVRCGDDLNPPSSQALGRLVTEIGVAPAQPLEYILVRIARDPDGSLSVTGDE
ncbi:MAG: phage tail sheath subtilisin-like domain-containing protein [Propionicimonas sp.]|uniref:phage tail sheath family protein n=1 Tax=Propionicimonas sp. TaxID=1955623 RepID=UPI003D128172